MEPAQRSGQQVSEQSDGTSGAKQALKQSAPAIGYRAGGQEQAPNLATPDAGTARTAVVAGV